MEIRIEDIDSKKIPKNIVSKITENISGWMLAGGNAEDPYIQEQLQKLKYYETTDKKCSSHGTFCRDQIGGVDVNREVETLFGIPIFAFADWVEIETGVLQLYNVEFPFPSMKKYNGSDVSIDMNGELIIYDEEGEEVWKGYACEIPEFMKAVQDIFKKK